MKTKIGLLSFIVLIAATFLQCHPYNTEGNSVPLEQESILVEGAGFFEDLNVQFAQNFSIENHETHKIAHIHFKSVEREIDFSEKIIFYPKGQPKPKITADLENAWMIAVPLITVAANHDGEISRLTSLGLRDNIVGMGGGGIYDTLLRRRWEEKKIASIGYSYHQISRPEIILALNPDVLLLQSNNHKKLVSVEKMRALGINAIPLFAWAEPSFLGKAEWIKFTALFFNKEKEANELFDKIVQRCTELRQLVETRISSPKAFMIYHPSSKGDWSAHRNDFYASFLEFAGARNVLKDNGPNHVVGMNNEMLLSLAKDADVWIVNSTSDADWPPVSYLQSFKAYRKGAVYHYQKRTRYEHDAYDWYETPVVRPDLVVADLVSILHPDLLVDHDLLFFERVILTK